MAWGSKPEHLGAPTEGLETRPHLARTVARAVNRARDISVQIADPFHVNGDCMWVCLVVGLPQEGAGQLKVPAIAQVMTRGEHTDSFFRERDGA